MKKILAVSIMILAMFQGYANEKSMTYSRFSEKYWGLFVPYVDTNAGSNKKEYLAVVIYFQNDTLSIISATGIYKAKYNIEDGIIKYYERNGKHLILRHLFYDQKNNFFYYKKPGYWYFIPQKIVYCPLEADVAQKAIKHFSFSGHYKFEFNEEKPK